MIPKSHNNINYLLCLFVVIIIIFLQQKNFFSPLYSFTNYIFSPVFSLQPSMFYQNLFFPNQIENKDNEILKLNEEIYLLKSNIAGFKYLEEENKSMRKLLGASIPANWKFEIANKVRVVGDDLFVYSGYMPIEKTLVVSTNSQNSAIYIGYTTEILGDMIKVVLPSNVLSRISVEIRNQNNLEKTSLGILEGRGESSYLTQILSSDNVENDNLIFLSGIGNSNLLVGKVKNVRISQSTAFKEADVELALDLSRTQTVYLVTKK